MCLGLRRLCRHASCGTGFVSKIDKLQPFSHNYRTENVTKVFQIGFGGVVEDDEELSCISFSAGIWGKRL